MEGEFSKTFVIKNKLGLHARAAAQFVKVSNRFSSDIKINKDGYEIDGKSILGLLSLAAVKGSTIKVTVSGEDAREALKALGELVESGFGEGVEQAGNKK